MNSEELSGPHDTPQSLRGPLLAVAAAALLGCVFAAVSTSDFMQHLDRQVHAIHCSFIPGAGKEIGESGCKAVMMSPYSSFLRESVWGGVPVSLWALATFAFLFARAAGLAWKSSRPSNAETKFLLVGTLLPVLMSVIYLFLSVSKVGQTCKVCVGIYVSSAAVFLAAALAHRGNESQPEAVPFSRYLGWFAQGVAFVAVLTGAYLMFAPGADKKKALSGCGALVSAEDPAGVMVTLHEGGEPAIEVLDPLCPSCKAFDTRLAASSFREKLSLKAVLFPLDPACNWMVTEALHPGACAMSEALLCAAGLDGSNGSKNDAFAREVLRWAFKQQDALRELAAKDEGAMRARIESQFPKVKGCLGSSQVKSKLTKSLRWAVANAIPVLTPQLFVGNARMCDEDTDLGLEYTLAKMLSPAGKTARAAVKAPPPPKPTVVPVAPPPVPAAKPKPVVPVEEEAEAEAPEEKPE
ncbi:MAG: hypothetical protein JNK82_21060 [Myxococcaceae bacterium]|nr:hypothetical protein [Myxococcaceae bacterium]